MSENSFRIVCLLYLTPVLPLGPVSYMFGTTSMPLSRFAAAKIAAVPLMMLYTFIGASTDTFFSSTVRTTTAAAYGDVFVETSSLANGDGGGGGIVGGGGVVTEEDENSSTSSSPRDGGRGASARQPALGRRASPQGQA